MEVNQQNSVDRQTDKQTDRQTGKLSTVPSAHTGKGAFCNYIFINEHFISYSNDQSAYYISCYSISHCMFRLCEIRLALKFASHV